MRRGYRGFLAEMLRTGSLRSLALQLRSGVLHAARRLLGSGPADPVALFFEHYGPDGFRLPDAPRRELQLAAESCLVCGLCSLECARVGGRPQLDPREAVVAALRLEIDLVRLGLARALADQCSGCAACSTVCPTGIPIHRVQDALARLGEVCAPAPAPGARAAAPGPAPPS